jgi:hypothetical protein
MFNLGEVEERDIIPIPMGQASDSGIGVDGWILKEIKIYDPTEKAGYSIGFVFQYIGNRTDSNGVPHKGAKFEHREFDPSHTTSLQMNDEDKKKSFDALQSRLKHILGRFISEENVKKVVAPNFEQLIKFIASPNALIKAAQNVQCTLKLIYDKKGYIKFPPYPNFISTEKYPKSFKYDPRYDRLVKEAPEPSAASSYKSKESNNDFGFTDDMDKSAPVDTVIDNDDDNPFA